MSGPLAGIRVVDLTMNVLGPMATQVLGDAGADVIKVEAPEGDPMRKVGPCRTADMGAYFLNINRNKRSLCLDLKQAPAREALLQVLAGADVFVHNIRRGAAARLGLDYAALAARFPRLIYASAGGFPKDGKRRDMPAFDDVMQGMSGLAALNRDTTGAPRYLPIVMADKFCGHALASAVGMALYHREKTGRGQEVHIPMMETMLAFNLIEHMWGATIREPELGVGYSRMLTPHRRPYATSDGHICLLAVTDDQWRRLFALIGRPALMHDPRFVTLTARAANIDAVYAVLTDAMTAHSTAEWRTLLDAADLPCGPVNTITDLLADPYLAETGFFAPVEHPTEGAMTMLSIPTSFSDSPAAIRLLPPKLGEHTEAVLREAGLAEAEIALVRGATGRAA